MIKVYGSTDNNNTHVDTSNTLLGAKQYATRNNYRNVSVRIGYNATLLEYKMNNKWCKYEDFLDDIFKDECEMCENKGYIETYNTELMSDTIERCDDCQTIASDVDALTKYNQENE